MNNIHVKDVASAILIVLKAALDGKAEEGAQGLCTLLRFSPDLYPHRKSFTDFACSMERRISYREWTEIMGNVSIPDNDILPMLSFLILSLIVVELALA